MSANIESIICNVRNLVVLTESIFCDLCSTWIHPKCSGLKKKDFTELSKSSKSWFCKKCLFGSLPCLPFYNATDHYVRANAFNSASEKANDEISCFVCEKNIKDLISNSVLCSISKHRLHLKCANLTKTKLKTINKRLWNCDHCNNFPFKELNNSDLQPLSFNSQTITSNIVTSKNQGYHSSQSFNISKAFQSLK